MARTPWVDPIVLFLGLDSIADLLDLRCGTQPRFSSRLGPRISSSDPARPRNPLSFPGPEASGSRSKIVLNHLRVLLEEPVAQ
jgi:hypothetical protein